MTAINIADLINLGDPSAKVTNIEVDEEHLGKHVYIEKDNPGMLCPYCQKRMLSKGVRVRKINHPVLQDGFKLILYVKIHKWKCDKDNYYDHDHFSFIEDNKQNTSLVPLMIMDYYKDLNLTARQIASYLNVSDTYAHETFMQYVSAPRLEFTEVVSIDEVHMKFDKDDLYSVIIMDFKSGQIIDMLPNRHSDTMEEYFLNIPLSERKQVKFLISDMYNPYIGLTRKYFPNAVSIVDSYHVISLILTHINRYINQVKRRYREKDEQRLKDSNYRNNANHKSISKSREVWLLEHYSFFLLKNQKAIDYTPHYRNIRGRGGYWFDPRSTEKSFFELDDKFEKIRDLKEVYISFNDKHVNDPEGALTELESIIKTYRTSGLAMYREIANTLEAYKTPIINSFTYIKDERHESKEDLLRRLSNGPMEGFNHKPKDLKRISRGVTNFEYTRARILWATRNNPSILGTPRSKEEISNPTGKKRGPYNKSK